MAEYGLPVTPDDIAAHLARAVDLEPTHQCAPSLAQVGDALADLDVRPGEVVLIGLSNGTPLLTCFFGVLFAGGVPAMLAAGTPVSRVRDIAERLGARTLITPVRSMSHRNGLRSPVGAAEAIRLAGIEARHHEPGDVVLLTSGTSGIFSGCLHRLSSLLRNAGRHVDAVGLRQSDTVLVNLPLNFSYALVAQALASHAVGARLVIAGPPFRPAAYSAALTEHKVTSSSLTPFMVRGLLAGDWRPPASVRMLTVGGEALDAKLAAGLLDRAPGLELYLTYGLTEAGPRVSTLSAHAEPAHRLSSVGRPLSGVEVSLRDVNDEGVGELLVTTDTVLRRKVGVEEGRAGSCFVGPGQLATGDLFRIDEDGYLYFRGRLSDFVITGGFKVSLASVRRIANAIPGVVTSATRTYPTDDGDTRFDLDLYLTDTDPDAVERARTVLLRQLLRAERPTRIRALPAEKARHK